MLRRSISHVCVVCLTYPHLPLLFPPVSLPPSLTLCEAKKALEVVIRYFGQQPIRLSSSERLLLETLAENLDPASNQISMFSGEHAFQ